MMHTAKISSIGAVKEKNGKTPKKANRGMTTHADRKKQLQHLAKKMNPTTHRSFTKGIILPLKRNLKNRSN